jgi:signal transduction histidine kinase
LSVSQGDADMNRGSRRRRARYAVAIAVAAIALIGGRQVYVSGPGYGLPYIASFLPGVKDNWNALGGTWEIVDGSMRNESNDRGAKLLTGSAHWKNYVIDGDVQLLGAGSAGVIARVSEAEVGENSFKGYYAGIRMADNSLDLGTFDFAYHEVAKLTLPDPVRTSRWYHIRLKADGCQISASAWADGMPEIKTSTLNDPDCFRSGAAGLRSNGTGGVWRNLTISPVDSKAHVRSAGVLGSLTIQSGPAPPEQGAPSPVPAQPVNTLIYLPPFESTTVCVRGAVILIRPAIYVEDATGGVEVQLTKGASLKIGDEVEVTGEVNLDKFSPVIRSARVRLLREAIPVSPVVATVNQVATGPFDGRFVQVEGYLRAISTARDNTVTMDLDTGTQSFHAVLPAGRSWSHVQNMALESRLRLRGVSLVDASISMAANPFAILVRSAEDVDVVAGPPWWRPSTLILACLVGLGLIFTANHLYLLAEHWRLRAVANERERLAHEIHDTLAQSFAGIGFQLQAIRNRVPPGDAAMKAQLDLAMTMARTSHEEARRSIASLRPGSLGSRRLLPALRESAERMVKNGNLKIETSGEDGGKSISPRIKDALYLIGQEAVANALRHAHPATIRIGLQIARASVCLSVEDDGEGFIADTDRAGFGLLGMRKRAESISATLTVKSKPGSGTRVEVKASTGVRSLTRPWPRIQNLSKDI